MCTFPGLASHGLSSPAEANCGRGTEIPQLVSLDLYCTAVASMEERKTTCLDRLPRSCPVPGSPAMEEVDGEP